MFTAGQIIRMRAMIAKGGPRQQITGSTSICGSSGTLAGLAVDSIIQNNLRTSNYETLSIFPNPVSKELQIRIPPVKENSSLVIYDAFGRLMHQESIGQSIDYKTLILNVQNWESGIYFVHANLGTSHQSKRFMVSK